MSIKQMKTLTVGETTYQVVDSTVPDWAREPTKPTDFAVGGTMGGSLTINGDLTVNGTSTTVETYNENVNVEDNTITLRYNATTGLQNSDYTGIIAQKYDGANNGMLVFDNTGTAYVGDEGDLQPLATRKLAAEDNGELVSWDAANQTLVKAPVKVENIVTKDNFDSLNTVLSTNTNNAEMSYVKDVPTDSANYAAVQKVGGMTYKSKNLLPAVSGYTFTVPIESGNNVIRMFSNVFLKEGIYTLTFDITSGGDNTRNTPTFTSDSGANPVYINTVENAFVSGGHQSFGVAIPSDGYYYFNWWLNETTIEQTVSNLMLNEGATALPYEPYFEGLRSAKVTEVKSVGVNLLPFPYNQSMVTNNGVTYTVNADGSVLANGTATEYTNAVIYLARNFVLPAGTYTFVFNDTVIQGAVMAVMINGSWFADVSTRKTITLKSGDALTIYLQVVGGVSVTNLLLKPRINPGDTAQPYTPYVKHTLPIPEAVRNKPWYGLGISKDVCNAIVWNEGGSVDGDIKCGIVDLGTLDWKSGASVGEFSALLKDAVDMYYGGGGVCSKYDVRYSNDNKSLYTTKLASEVGCVVVDSDYTDAASFKAAMQGVMLVYELKEPIVTDISDLITADNLIGVEVGGTLTFENEYGYAVPSEVVFYNEKAEIVAADKIVGDLIGTAKRAISDEDGNDIVNTYVKKTGVVEKAIMADRLTAIDLSQYNGTDNIPVEFARAVGDDKCYAFIIVQSGSLYPPCLYYISNDDGITQIAGRINNTLITYKEDYMATDKTIGFYCGKLGHNFPQITVLAFNGNISFFVGEKRTNENLVENSKYLYFGKHMINDENATTLEMFSRGANGLTFGQAETLKTFAVGETITISGTTNTVRIETDGFDLSDGVYAVTFELTSTGPDYHYRFTGMIDWVKSAALSSFISIIDNLRIQVSYVQFLSKTVLVVEMIDKLIPNIGRVTANYTFTLRRIY